MPAPATPTLPAAPVLEGDGAVSMRREWLLTGSAPEGTVVRVHLDVDCRGPSWRDLTAEELRAGLLINLVGGPENVFAAVAIDARGAVSDCSDPVRVRFDRPPLPQQPDVQLTPALPTRETHFVIKGHAADATTVRLFDLQGRCDGVPLATLSEEDYGTRGFELDVTPNVSHGFVLDALNALGERSSCNAVVSVYSDQTPPFVTAALLSPTPSPDRRAFIELTQELVDWGYAYLGADCVGAGLASCNGSGCRLLEVEFPELAVQPWSAFAIDSLGNRSACVNSSTPWEWDPGAPSPTVRLFASGQWLRALVPARNAFVEIYDGPTCDLAQLRARVPSRDLASSGLFTSSFTEYSDGGVLTARSSSALGSTDEPCSAPVRWY